MKIYILPVSPEFQPLPLPYIYPPHNKRDYGVEQDFTAYLARHPELVTNDPAVADWHYLGIYFTRWHLNHGNGKYGHEELRREVDRCALCPERTFAVCQHDDGPLEYPDSAVQFLASRRGSKGVDIPLMSDPHAMPIAKPEKRWLASFVGRLETQPMRREMARILGAHDFIDIRDGQWGIPYFVHQMLESYVALCPRGYGGSSFRFFEAMSLGVCPMLIGDIDNRPFKKWIDWEQASAYARTPEEAEGLLKSTAPSDWLERGERAYEIYNRDLAWGQWCRYVFKELGWRCHERIAALH